MKHRQFGIRLLLLIVGLAAVFFGWRHAEKQAKLANVEYQRICLQSKIEVRERLITSIYGRNDNVAIGDPTPFLRHDGPLKIMQQSLLELH